MISFQYGGFALPKPQLNYDVTLSADGQELLGRASCCCDMVWPEAKVIVEYDGMKAHMEEEQFHYDKRRTTALVLSGYKVINVTKDHLKNTKTIEELFLLIRKTLKLRTRKERFDKYKDKRRETIWKIFFTSNRRKGGFPTCGF